MKDVHDPTNPTSNLVVAIQYSDGVAVVTTVPVSPFLCPTSIDNNSTSNNNTAIVNNEGENRTFPLLWDTKASIPSPIMRLDHHVWGVSAGDGPSGQVVRRSRLFAASQSERRTWGVVNARVLSRSLADMAQKTTQHSGESLNGSCLLVFSNDGLWRVDPNGQYFRCSAAIVGKASSLRLELDLRKRLGNGTVSRQEALKAAAETITGTLEKSKDRVLLQGITVEHSGTSVSHSDLVQLADL